MKGANFLDNPEAKASWGDSKPLIIQQSKRIKQEIKRDPDGDDESIPVIDLDITETMSANSILNGAHEEMFLLQVTFDYNCNAKHFKISYFLVARLPSGKS